MTIRPILTAPDPRLKAVSTPVEKVDDEIRRLIDDMAESMYEADGIGLAAVQIGTPRNIIVMDLDQKSGQKNPRAFINPKILWASEELVTFEEGAVAYDHRDAAGFIRLNALRLRTLGQRKRKLEK